MNTTIRILLIFTFAVLVFSACESATTESLSNAPQTAAVQNEIKQISVEQAKTAVEAKDVQFIDVRTPEEYAGGRAPKAVNFPLDALDKDLTKLDKDKPVYVICQTGKRSQKGSEILQKAGFKNIYNINGGTSEWIKAGFPTEK
jgi:rhodanese-related sulfurtransferase